MVDRSVAGTGLPFGCCYSGMGQGLRPRLRASTATGSPSAGRRRRWRAHRIAEGRIRKSRHELALIETYRLQLPPSYTYRGSCRIQPGKENLLAAPSHWNTRECGEISLTKLKEGC